MKVSSVLGDAKQKRRVNRLSAARDGEKPDQHLFATRRFTAALFICLLVTCAPGQNASPANAKLNRERGLQMLSEIKEIVKKEYYDPQFRGLDLDKHFKTASEQISRLETNSQIFAVIAQVLLDFNDSHTLFFPPSRINRVEYGFSLQMIGDNIHVVDVKEGSDADKQGLKVGDVIIGINGFAPQRTTLWTMLYFLYQLDPQPALTLTLKSSERRTRETIVRARILTPSDRRQELTQRKELEKQRPELRYKPYKCREVNADLIACKLFTFSVETGVVDKMMKEVGQHKKLILDLRRNGGGYLHTELYLTGYFFDHDVKVGHEVGRKRTNERIAKSRKAKAFGGELVVLIDSRSASASEVFARVVQTEKRGKVVGDTSAGSVMTSVHYLLATLSIGREWQPDSFPGGVSVTVGNLVMGDGRRLEGSGVVPDLTSVPTGQDLAAKTDPVLAYAVALCGARISKEEAGKFYFIARVPEASGEEDH
jgi:C-terminal processing protease CtpA/Prc